MLAPSPCFDPLNLYGFFILDDVPLYFIESHPSLNGKCTTLGAIDTIRSDFTDPHVLAKEMSQDQLYHLLIGLALVSRLAGNFFESVRELDGNVRSVNFGARARDAVDRMVRYVRHGF